MTESGVRHEFAVRLRVSLENRSTSPQRLTIAYNCFPGWTARTAWGAMLIVEPAEEIGYIRMPQILPGGSELTVTFGNTPIRAATKLLPAPAWIAWVAGWMPRAIANSLPGRVRLLPSRFVGL